MVRTIGGVYLALALALAMLGGCYAKRLASDAGEDAGRGRPDSSAGHGPREGGADRDHDSGPAPALEPDAQVVPAKPPPARDACAVDNGGCGDRAQWSCTTAAGGTAVCSDVDECAVEHGGCGQHCFNSEGGFHCYCDPDAALDANDRTCSRWVKPQYIGDLSFYGELALATNAPGQAVLVAHNRSDGVIYANHYRPGTGWGPQLIVDEAHREDQGFGTLPQVVLDAAGNALLLSRGALHANDQDWPHELRFQRYDAAEDRWSSPLVLDAWSEPPNSEQAEWLRLQLDGSGNALAAWGGRGVSASRWSAADRAWSTPVLLEPDLAASEPLLSVDGAGNALVLWLNGGSLWAARYEPASGWGDPTSIRYDPTATRPKLVMDGAGNAVAMWIAAGYTELWAARYELAAGWGDASVLEQGAGEIGRWSLALSHAGDGLAVWAAQGYVRSKRFEPGAGWAPAVELNQAGALATGTPQLAMDENGDALVTWGNRADREQGGIWANVRTAGEWSGETLLEREASLAFPRLGAAAGQLVVVQMSARGPVVMRHVNGQWGQTTRIEASSRYEALLTAWLDGGFALVWTQNEAVGAKDVAVSIYAAHAR